MKKMLFKYNNGFFDLPIMSNSPETVIKSLSKMPFVQNKPKENRFYSNNPFLNANIYYKNVERGLWYLHSHALYKENVNYIQVNEKSLKSSYYMLYLEINTDQSSSKNPLFNGIPYSNCSWVLTKPQVANTHCRFKGNDTISMVVNFDERWVRDVLLKTHTDISESLKSFFDSSANLIMGLEEKAQAEELRADAELLFKNLDTVDSEKWNEFVVNFIRHFVKRYDEQGLNERLLELSYVNRAKIIHAEKLLRDKIYGPFMGIEGISSEVGLSATKLKSYFKLVYGDTIFNYFRKCQLGAASIILEREATTVKNVAHIFGYESSSKFTAAFKKELGYLPSEILKKVVHDV